MFIGQHSLTLDPQNRITLPESMRRQLEQGVVMTQGFDSNLILLTEASFGSIVQQARTMSITDPAVRMLLRMMLGSAVELQLSEDGRLDLPDALRNFAGLEASAMLVGQGDYLEIWSSQNWREQCLKLGNVEITSSQFSMFEIVLNK
jgi:MraZ protein